MLLTEPARQRRFPLDYVTENIISPTIAKRVERERGLTWVGALCGGEGSGMQQKGVSSTHLLEEQSALLLTILSRNSHGIFSFFLNAILDLRAAT